MTVNVYILQTSDYQRENLVNFLSQKNEIQVVGAGAALSVLLKSLPSNPSPNVLVVNLDQFSALPLIDWARLRARLPDLRIVALCADSRRGTLERALGLGVAALHHVSAPPATVFQAILVVSRGDTSFDPALLEKARIRVFQTTGLDRITLGDLTIDLHMMAVTRGADSLRLTPLETKVLVCLASRTGEVVEISELLEAAWDCTESSGGTKDQVKSCVKRLRRKINCSEAEPVQIQTVRGRGYRLDGQEGGKEAGLAS